MKKVVATLLLLLVILTGCTTEYSDRMRVLEQGDGWYVLVDTETGVCYFRSSYGTCTVMVDHTGKPYIANGWRDWGADDEED